MQRKIAEATTMLVERMTRLKEQCSKLKDILKQKTIQNCIARSSSTGALEAWRHGEQTQPMDNTETGAE